jgi:histidine triad (HIT) family protein
VVGSLLCAAWGREEESLRKAEQVWIMGDCPFCDILEDKAEASCLLREKLCWAFLDIQPVNDGHVLIIPTRHVASVSDLDSATGAEMFQMAQGITGALGRTGLMCEGVNWILADGASAGQEVFHVHLHIIPRFQGDGFGFRFGPDYETKPGRDKLDEVAAKIRSALQ